MKTPTNIRHQFSIIWVVVKHILIHYVIIIVIIIICLQVYMYLSNADSLAVHIT